MIKLLLFAILLVSFSCESIDLGLSKEQAKQSEILSSLTGEFNGCTSDYHYSFLKRNTTVTISSDELVHTFFLSSGGGCSAVNVLSLKYIYNILSVSTIGDNNIDFELSVKNIFLTLDSDLEVSRNRCGFNAWIRGEERNVTGDYCPGILGVNPHSDYLKNVGELEFIRLKSTGDAIYFPSSFAESGNNSSEIKFSQTHQLLR